MKTFDSLHFTEVQHAIKTRMQNGKQSITVEEIMTGIFIPGVIELSEE